jgi:hypothetical protein
MGPGLRPKTFGKAGKKMLLLMYRRLMDETEGKG